MTALFFDMGLQQLFQLDLTQTPVAAAPIPGVDVDQVASVELRSFEGEGRKCVLTREYAAGYSAAAEVHTLLADPDNDGVFSAPVTLDQAHWQASPYADFSLWDLYWWR